MQLTYKQQTINETKELILRLEAVLKKSRREKWRENIYFISEGILKEWEGSTFL